MQKRESEQMQNKQMFKWQYYRCTACGRFCKSLLHATFRPTIVPPGLTCFCGASVTKEVTKQLYDEGVLCSDNEDEQND